MNVVLLKLNMFHCIVLKIVSHVLCSQTWCGVKIHGYEWNGGILSAPRMCLLMMLVICMNGTILLEQPSNSVLEFYPRFRDLLGLLEASCGSNAVPWFEFLLPYGSAHEHHQTKIGKGFVATLGFLHVMFIFQLVY